MQAQPWVSVSKQRPGDVLDPALPTPLHAAFPMSSRERLDQTPGRGPAASTGDALLAASQQRIIRKKACFQGRRQQKEDSCRPRAGSGPCWLSSLLLWLAQALPNEMDAVHLWFPPPNMALLMAL